MLKTPQVKTRMAVAKYFIGDDAPNSVFRILSNTIPGRHVARCSLCFQAHEPPHQLNAFLQLRKFRTIVELANGSEKWRSNRDR